MLKLLALSLAAVEPDPNAPPSATPFTAFATPPNSPGGLAHLTLDPAVSPKPSALTAVYLPAGSIAPEAIDPSVVGNAAYPQGSLPLTDPTLTVASIQVAPVPAPGSWDIAVFGTFPDA